MYHTTTTYAQEMNEYDNLFIARSVLIWVFITIVYPFLALFSRGLIEIY